MKRNNPCLMKIVVNLPILIFCLVACNHKLTTVENNPPKPVIDSLELPVFITYDIGARFPCFIGDTIQNINSGDCSNKKMKEFISQSLTWPKNFDGEGSVWVSFMVEKDGSLTNIEVRRDLGGGTREEAIRIILLMPNWIPGTFNGRPVRSQYSLPIKFKLE